MTRLVGCAKMVTNQLPPVGQQGVIMVEFITVQVPSNFLEVLCTGHFKALDFQLDRGILRFRGYADTQHNNPWPEHMTDVCEECSVPRHPMVEFERVQVDVYGRTLWLCGKEYNNCANTVMRV